MPRNGSHQGASYTDIDEIVDVDGVVAVISERKKGSILSVAFFKEFTRDGNTERSAFLQRRHLDAVERLIPQVRDRMDAYVDRQKAAERAQSRQPTTMPDPRSPTR